ncbi:unnamed protein product (macronuclear) [Paramecium tetraurelia]|uniref:Uncharacterized protein n=1 Tax=Paramecium tetraurelia TaxID=5888 RepID=A0EED1_PARTE|nr:uncharacterized protein GSPATT00025994001 [Paramecium tetraurelia]CAK93649.1 unnamed protein product [Paramecium tetraurelia]|eukprot:XP_001461045.1 hypothetical protein (macronuclear) [Paramecium tetraurelia strain d4-2]
MSEEVCFTEIKKKNSSKHFPLIDLTEIKPQVSFLESLLQKKYQLNKKIQQYTLGKVYLESHNEKAIFRVFQDSDLNISSIFQKKLNKTSVDDDVMTTSSQIANANRQNRKDVIFRIFEVEKPQRPKQIPLEEMERSLFGSTQENNSFFTQQLQVTNASKLFLSQQ